MAQWLVEPNALGGWDVRLYGVEKYADRTLTRNAAEEAARRFASQAGGDIVVLDSSGNVLASYPMAPPPVTGLLQTPAKIPPLPSITSASAPPLIPAPQEQRDRGKEISDVLGSVGKIIDDATGDISGKGSLDDALEKKLVGKADDVLDAGFQSWWKRADGNQRLAARVLILAALVGPIGATLLSVAQDMAHPTVSVQIFEALVWLAFLTLPVLFAAGAAVLVIGRANGAITLMTIAGAAIVGAVIVGSVDAPTSLSHLYCYASLTTHGAIYQSQCRLMDTYGYVRSATQGGISPSRSPVIVAEAFTLVGDARGYLMALCGVAVGVAGGYLVRRANT